MSSDEALKKQSRSMPGGETEMYDLIESIKKHEGFRGMPYDDSLGIPTIGYGTKLPITPSEGDLLLKSRMYQKKEELDKAEPFVKELPKEKQDVLLEMAYQLGVGGLLKFRRMWKALKKFDYEEAAKEALDSRWAKQTQNRANELANKLREV